MEEIYEQENLDQRIENLLNERLDQRIRQVIDQRVGIALARIIERLDALAMNRNQGMNPNPNPRHASVEEDNEISSVEGSYVDELPRGWNRPRAIGADNRQWEVGMRTEIPKFHGTMKPEEFPDWLAIVEEILEFKGVTKNKRVQLVATRLRDGATAWW